MVASILKRKLFELPKLNWWLWMCLSIPLSVYLLVTPYDHSGDGGDVYSDWATIPFWMQNFKYYSLWFLCRELGWPFFHSIYLPFTIGLVAQYFLLSFGVVLGVELLSSHDLRAEA